MVSLIPGGRDPFAGTSRSTPRDDFLASIQGLISQAGSEFRGPGNIGSFGVPAFRRQQAQSRAAEGVLRNPGFFQALAGFDDGGGGRAQGSSQVDQLISGLAAGGRRQVSGAGGGGGAAPATPILPTAGGASKASGGGARGSTSISGSAISLLTPVDDDQKKLQTLLGG